MYYLGIDAGSTTTKGVLFKNEDMLDYCLFATAGMPLKVMEQVKTKLLNKHDLVDEDIAIITTGYARKLLPADLTLTEITCHARGARYIKAHVTNVIDIGGQDCKTISLSNTGQVIDFNMNDKCAAGTGRFVEVMMQTLGCNLADVDLLVKNVNPVKINSMCAVFAESEMISLIAQGVSKEKIARGVLDSIAERVANQYLKVQQFEKPTILFTGGLTRSLEFTELLSLKIGYPIVTSKLAPFAGAIGASLLGQAKLSQS